VRRQRERGAGRGSRLLRPAAGKSATTAPHPTRERFVPIDEKQRRTAQGRLYGRNAECVQSARSGRCLTEKRIFNVTNRIASILLVSTLLIAIVGGVLISPSSRFGEMGRIIHIAYIADLFAVFFFIVSKIASSLCPLNFKWESLSRNEEMFFVFNVFLTKEAREEWRGYINEKKQKTTS
jgi:hypothetical protein